MFKWYRDAAVCYAYLADVPSSDMAMMAESADQTPPSFWESRWFTRGWTLQELIAPSIVVFFTLDWLMIGTRNDLIHAIASITKISRKFLVYGNLSQFSVAQKMSWACRRQTTRVEDEAYCLLGLFGVNIPLLYGEGKRAFFRLQEAIMKASDDQSIFAWTTEGPEDQEDPLCSKLSQNRSDGPGGGLLALSPAQFWKSNSIVRCPHDKEDEPYSVTNKGIQIRLPIIDDASGWSMPFVPSEGTKYEGSFGVRLTFSPTGCLAILNCRISGECVSKVALVIEKSGASETYKRASHIPEWIPVSEKVIKKAWRQSVLIKTHNLDTNVLLWSNEKRGRLVLMQPLPSVVSPPYQLTKVVSENRRRHQANGGLSFSLRESRETNNRIALVYQRPSDPETFLLVLEAKGRPGYESVSVRLVTNLKQPSDGVINTYLANKHDAPAADRDPSSHFIQTAQGSVSVRIHVKQAPHACLVSLSASVHA